MVAPKTIHKNVRSLKIFNFPPPPLPPKIVSKFKIVYPPKIGQAYVYIKYQRIHPGNPYMYSRQFHFCRKTIYQFDTSSNATSPRRTHFKKLSVYNTYEPRHEISNNVACATSKASYQPAHTRSLIRALASRLNIL